MGKNVNNIVFMGMGEPLLNYDNLLGAIKIINDPSKLNIGARSISVSTVGLIKEIRKLSKEKIQLNLAISLHAPSDNVRNKLIPINKTNSLIPLLKEARYFIKKTNRKLMIEYLLLNNINDSKQNALQLSQLLKKYLKNLFFVNIIPYNPTSNKLKSSSKESINEFKITLQEQGIFTTQRYEFAKDIDAACGQLAGKSYNR